MIETRFSSETGVYIGKDGGGKWRHIDCNSSWSFAPVGPKYNSKEELLADHDNYLRRAGWLK